MTNEQSLEGILFLFSETGTEGGHWAFQDSRFITPNTTRYSCNKCHLYWDKRNGPFAQNVSEKSSHADLPDYCSPDAHQFELVSGENWSYEGLNILKNGDQLTIYHPDNNSEVWSGVIALKQHPLFTEHASGFWIHADQIGIDRNTWAEYFFKGYSARLIPFDESQ